MIYLRLELWLFVVSVLPVSPVELKTLIQIMKQQKYLEVLTEMKNKILF